MPVFKKFLTSVVLWALLAVSAAAQPLFREPNYSLQLPLQPPAFGYTVEDALPGLTFAFPVAMASVPGDTNRLFIAEQAGAIFVITNLAHPTRTLFLDLSDIATGGTPQKQQGFASLVFHPGYASNGWFYVAYAMLAPGGGFFDRVSRFQVSPVNPNVALAGSEVVLIQQFDENETHNINDLKFGPDGYLYIAAGDEGDPADYLNNGQRIDKDFFSGVLRIDVDKRAGNLLPNLRPGSSTNYLVPLDNPFVGATAFNGEPVNPGLVRTEFFAVGLRNPWRIAFDPETDVLYCGDVGESDHEEINVITRGANYGWAFAEGTQAGPKAAQAPPNFVYHVPILEYPHGSGFYAGNSVIGGVVYRGTRLGQLRGAYVFADYVSGNIWQARYDGVAVSDWQRLAFDKDISSFGVDPRNGDVLMADMAEGRIKRLDYTATPIGAPLPPTLGEVGAFYNVATLQPNPGVVPYELNVPFWSDNAIKRRWFSIPDPAGRMTFDAQGNWQFPPGTVWIKQFELELTNGLAASRRRLETRFLVRNAQGIYGVTYRWNSSGSNGQLVRDEGMDETFVIHDNAGGILRTQVWHYPSRSECLVCHTPVGGFGLGFNTAQLNRDFTYAAATTNQLRALAHAGYFHEPVPDESTLPQLAPATHPAASIEWRARSYLNANCAHCHQPGGSGGGFWDARISTPIENAGLLHGLLRETAEEGAARVIKPGSTNHSMLLTRITAPPARRMPPLATSLFDTQGIALLRSWILSLPPTDQPPPPAPPTGVRTASANGQVQVSWAVLPEADRYVVKRSTSSGYGYVTAGLATNTVFLDTGLANETNYYYVVVAENENGQSTYSLEARARPSSRPIPVVYVSFNELIGTTTLNLGSAGGTFTLTVPRPERTPNVPDLVGGARSLDFDISPGDYAVDSDAILPALGGMPRFTITGWINNRSAAQGPGGNRIVSWIDTTGHGVDLAYKSDGSLVLGVNQRPDGRARSSTGIIPEDVNGGPANWRFFAVTYAADASNDHARFYLGSNTGDATLDIARSYPGQGPVGTNIGRMTVGHLNPTTRAGTLNNLFLGLVDEIQVFTNALTLSEIIAVQRTISAGPPPVPTINIVASTPAVTEGSGGAGQFTISRNGSTATDLEVQLLVSGSAVPGVDFIGIGSSIILPQGMPSVTIEVLPLDDALSEFPENVTVALVAQPTYVLGLLHQASVTILDDEPPPPTFTITASEAEASEPGAKLGTFTISRSGSVDLPAMVQYTVSGTATPGADYVPMEGSVFFPAWATSSIAVISPLDDEVCEPGETVVVTLQTNAGYLYFIGAPNSATVTLIDNECVPPTVTLFALNGVTSEAGTPGALKLMRSGAATSNLTVRLNFTGTATPGGDFVFPSEVTLLAGMPATNLALVAIDDPVSESTETAVVMLASDPAYRLDVFHTAEVLIGDNDSLRPLVHLPFDDASPASTTNTGLAGGVLSITPNLPVRSLLVPTNIGSMHAVDFLTANGPGAVETLAPLPRLGDLAHFTITGWLNNRISVVAAGGNRIVNWQSPTSGNGVDLVFRSDGALDIGIDQPPNGLSKSSVGRITTDLAASPSNWRFFAVIYEAAGQAVRYYFGSQDADAVFDKVQEYSGVGAVGTNITPLVIGNVSPEARVTTGNRQYRGLIDDLRIYGEVLTLPQIVGVQHGARLDSPVGALIPRILSVNILPDGSIHLRCAGKSGETYRILAGDTPMANTPVHTHTVGTTGLFEFAEPHRPHEAARFYRVTRPM